MAKIWPLQKSNIEILANFRPIKSVHRVNRQKLGRFFKWPYFGYAPANLVHENFIGSKIEIIFKFRELFWVNHAPNHGKLHIQGGPKLLHGSVYNSFLWWYLMLKLFATDSSTQFCSYLIYTFHCKIIMNRKEAGEEAKASSTKKSKVRNTCQIDSNILWCFRHSNFTSIQIKWILTVKWK